MKRAVVLSMSLAFAGAAAAQAPSSSPAPAPAAKPASAAPAAAGRDPTDPRMREAPVRCRPGQVDLADGRTLGQLFGADWPAAPDVPAARRTAAEAVSLGRVEWPAANGQATAVSAVLVDAAGRPLKARVLCASNPALVAAVEAAALAGTYRAATFDGAPATSLAIVSWRVGAAR